MIINFPDGLIETASAAFIGLQSWQVHKLFQIDKKIAVLQTLLPPKKP